MDQNICRVGRLVIHILLVAVASCALAQSTRVRVASSRRVAVPAPAAAAGAAAAPTAPSGLTAIGRSNTEIDLTWVASTEAGGSVAGYRIERCTDATCTNVEAIGTSASASFSDTGGIPPLLPHTTYAYRVLALDADGNRSGYSNTLVVTTASSRFTCTFFPTRGGCMEFGHDKNGAINAFYQTEGPFSFFSQVNSIYNRASGSATLSADLASLNFSNGMQVTVTTNVQAGPQGTSTGSGTVPTLSSTAAAQATQNLLFGGTFLVSELYPVFYAGASKLGSPGGFGVAVDFIAKEGADIQNFTSGTNVNVSSPPFHVSANAEGYVQYNSINLIPNSQNFVGAVFIGGSYGESYMSHVYARNYGFANVYNRIGQISLGVVLNGSARITVSRGFGPSQTFIDSTSMATTTANNFKSWSFGVVYQSPTPSK